jgi:hypothetical protein
MRDKCACAVSAVSAIATWCLSAALGSSSEQKRLAGIREGIATYSDFPLLHSALLCQAFG